MNILLIGAGGREHALAWKLAQSPSVRRIYVVPGNGGLEGLSRKVSVLKGFEPSEYCKLAEFAKYLRVGLVVIGPDSAVVAGVEAHFRRHDIPCFAPSKKAAELEGSKAFAKDFMARHCIPTANYQSCDSHDAAQAYVSTLPAGHRVVIKVDGLASGKGVILPKDKIEGQRALREIMVEQKFGSAGRSVVIEDFMEGEEISVLTFSDGLTFKSLPPAQDHKAIFDGNQGPNTGGMGVLAPVPFVTEADMQNIEDTIIQPTLDGLKLEGRPFVGMLFTGIMMTPSGPRVLEYNVRFGDPETQSMVMLLAPDADLADILLACCMGQLASVSIPLRPGYACNVVVAADGYPGEYDTNIPIEIGACPEDVCIFHAGTKWDGDRLKTAGGRVFSVAAYGTSIKEAVDRAYQGVNCIEFQGAYHRTDIGKKWC